MIFTRYKDMYFVVACKDRSTILKVSSGKLRIKQRLYPSLFGPIKKTHVARVIRLALAVIFNDLRAPYQV